MKIAVIGTGYVGLPTGACLADLGNNVICVDKDVNKINDLKNSKITIYEPDLSEIITKNYVAKRIDFTTDLKHAVTASEIIILAVGTMTCEQTGNADLSHIEAAVADIAKTLNSKDYKVIVVKSTVRVGTNEQLIKLIKNINPDANFDIISIPEFLREGKAVYDFFNPERIVIGSESIKAQEVIKTLYTPFINKGVPTIFCSFKSAEMIKYAANSFLGIKVSFINELADLCEVLGANIEEVAKGIGLDSRIGSRFLKPGPGFGGSCLPKDMLEITTTAKNNNSPLTIVEAAMNYNTKRITLLVNKIENTLGSLNNKQLAILGLSFKAETDDIRKSPPIDIIKLLLNKGAAVTAFDPKAMENTKKILPNIAYKEDIYDAATNADALVILTEWSNFANLDFAKLSLIMKNKVIIDFRNLLNYQDVLNAGFKYVPIATHKKNND